MTMVSTGEISIGGSATSGGLNRSINIELGRAATATSSLNESALRTLAGVPSGAISLSNFYGKSNVFAFTISSNQLNANLRSLALNAGWNQSSAVQATVAAGVYIYSTSTGTPGLTIDGSWPGGVTLTNNGFIMGMGGEGGGNGVAGFSGGPAISLGVNCSIVNNSYIGGGGGGGGGPIGGGGGGAGGGVGGYGGGAGGGPGSSGGNGNIAGSDPYGGIWGSGGGGGRIMPGTGGAGGTYSSSGSAMGGKGGGSGGGGGSNWLQDVQNGGSGGSGGSAGSNAGGIGWSGAGGGGWGASGGNAGGSQPSRLGGAGGKAINLNGFTATRTGSGTTYGTVS